MLHISRLSNVILFYTIYCIGGSYGQRRQGWNPSAPGGDCVDNHFEFQLQVKQLQEWGLQFKEHYANYNCETIGIGDTSQPSGFSINIDCSGLDSLSVAALKYCPVSCGAIVNGVQCGTPPPPPSPSCQGVTAPTHGGMGTCTNTLASGSSCQPTCSSGYTVSGTSSCNAGTLTAAICSANSCNAAAPYNGVAGACTGSLNSGSSCQPQCKSGYTLSGTSSCSAGTFTSATCQPNSCQGVTAPTHGGMGTCTNTLASGSSCQPTCSSGYTVSGTSSCSAGALTAAICSANSCPAAAPDNGVAGTCTSSLSSGSSCQPQCKSGYTVSGTSSCHTGTFTSATCQPNSCQGVTAPTHGGMGTCTNTLAPGSSCQPTCNAGYTVSGTSSCSAGTLTPAICSANSCPAAAPDNGVAGTCTSSLNSGSSCQPQCKSGYTVSGTSSCHAGTFTSAICQPNSCQGVTAPTHGGMGTCTNTLASGSSCQPTCNAGYTVSGTSSCSAGALTAAICSANSCPAAAPDNGVAGTCTSSLSSGSSCQPQCKSGYTVSGTSSCHTGTFTSATCQPNSCQGVTAPTHGGMGTCTNTLASGSSCQPTCNAGYTVSGTSSCSAGTLTAAICSANSCPAAAPDNGVAGTCTSSLSSGSSCQPQCKSGYTLSGTSSCHAGTFTSATCQPKTCDASVAPSNGAKGTCTKNMASGSLCQPTCNSGYTVSGTSTCTTGTLTAATCKAHPCDASVGPINGNAGSCTGTLAHGSSCQPQCKPGYTVTGTSSCSIKGKFTAATCIPNSCNASAPPSYGHRGNCTHALLSGSLCQPTCKSGYTVSGHSICNVGNLTAAVCNADPCVTAAPANGNVGNCNHTLVSGTKCQPQCNSGYTVSGPSSCFIGNLTAATCNANSCNASAPPSYGHRGNCTSALLSGSLCQSTCKSGYTVSGHSICNAGNLTAAVCNADPCVAAAPTNGNVGNCNHTLVSGAKCQPQCNSGYTVSGPSSCFTGNLTAATCNANSCNASAPPSYGHRGNCTSALLSGSLCQPTCKSGYTVSGHSICNAGNLTAAVCNADPCVTAAPANGNVGNCNHTLVSGAKCQPQCNSGYTVSGPSSCTTGNLTAATCNANSCDASAPPSYGHRGNCTSALLSGSLCQPTCKSGYTVSGHSICNAGNLTAAVCNADPCVTTAPANGNVGDCHHTLVSGAKCQPQCKSGYTVSGPSSCTTGNLTAATCNANPCDASAAPANGAKGNCTNTLTSGATCQPQCNFGYTVSGPSSCTTGTLTAATCIANPCDASAAPANGDKGNCTSTLLSGHTCQPQCKSGYNASGTSSCNAGTLTAAICKPGATICSQLLCPAPVLNGDKTIILEQNSSGVFEDPGAKCKNYNVRSTGNVNVKTPGNYTVTYECFLANSTKKYKGATNHLNVRVVDTVKPVIKLPVSEVLAIDVAIDVLSVFDLKKYAHCDDGINGIIDLNFTGTVNMTLVGEYLISISCSDASGNEAVAKQLKVKVQENTCDVNMDKLLHLIASNGTCKNKLNVNNTCTPIAAPGYEITRSASCSRINGTKPTFIPPIVKVQTCTTIAQVLQSQSNIKNYTSCNNLEYNKTCTPECISGYHTLYKFKCTVLTGQTKVTLALNDTDTNVLSSEQLCVPIPCNVSAPANGALNTCDSKLAANKACTFKCNDGYKLHGGHSQDHQTYCIPDGSGTLVEAQCRPIENCTGLSMTVLNQIVGNGVKDAGNCSGVLKHSKHCTPNCKHAFENAFDGHITCDDGEHKNKAFTCSQTAGSCKIDDANPYPNNTGYDSQSNLNNCKQTVSQLHPYVLNATNCRVACNSGYIAYDGKCLNGKYTPPKCSPKGCSSTMVHNEFDTNVKDKGNCHSSLASGEMCIPHCKDDYDSDNVAIKCNLGSITQKTSCTPKGCQGLGAINKTTSNPLGVKSGCANETMLSGEECNLQCDAGYKQVGTVKCERGVVTKKARCIPKSCQLQDQESESILQLGQNCTKILESGQSCTPACNSGYKTQGQISCNLGTLSYNATCIQLPCTATDKAPLNGTKGNCNSTLSIGGKCRPQCHPGLHLVPSENGSIQDPNDLYRLCRSHPQTSMPSLYDVKCQLCPDNPGHKSYSTLPIGNAKQTCKQCKLGTHYATQCNGAACGGCEKCDPGTVSLLKDYQKCQKCDPGKYVKNGECKESDLGHYAAQNATMQIKCPSGYYQNRTGQASCRKSDLGYYSAQNATMQVKCAVGYYQNQTGQTDCKIKQQCNKGQYNANPASSNILDRKCMQCAEGTITRSPNQDSCSSCNKGHFCKNGLETQCQTHHYNDEIGKSGCKLCPHAETSNSDHTACKTQCEAANGKFYDNTTKTCKSATPCAAGTEEHSGPTYKQNRICKNCTFGYFSNVNTSKCKLWKTCGKGTRIDPNNQGTGTSDRHCLNCHPEYFSNETNSQQCFKRHECLDGTLIEKGEIKTANNITLYTKRGICTCAVNKGLKPSGQECEVCQYPEYNNETTSSSCKSTSCPVGQGLPDDARTNMASRETCQTCATGKYSTTNASATCLEEGCQAGQYYELVNPSTKRKCKNCIPGKYQDQDSKERDCKTCPLGQYSNTSARICTACREFKFNQYKNDPTFVAICGKQFNTSTTADCKDIRSYFQDNCACHGAVSNKLLPPWNNKYYFIRNNTNNVGLIHCHDLERVYMESCEKCKYIHADSNNVLLMEPDNGKIDYKHCDTHPYKCKVKCDPIYEVRGSDMATAAYTPNCTLMSLETLINRIPNNTTFDYPDPHHKFSISVVQNSSTILKLYAFQDTLLYSKESLKAYQTEFALISVHNINGVYDMKFTHPQSEKIFNEIFVNTQAPAQNNSNVMVFHRLKSNKLLVRINTH